MCGYVCANNTLVCGTELPLLLKNLTIKGLAALRASLSCLQNTIGERERYGRECKWFSQAQASVSTCACAPTTNNNTYQLCDVGDVNMHNYVRVFVCVCLPLALTTRPLVAKTKITQNKRQTRTTTMHTNMLHFFFKYYENCWKNNKSGDTFN